MMPAFTWRLTVLALTPSYRAHSRMPTRGSVMGLSDAGTGTGHWWHGTKFAKMIMLLNYEQDQDSTVLVGGLNVTAESPGP